MTTVFALLRQVCGLSYQEAAGLLRARFDSVKSWESGRRRAPDGALAELASLAARIDKAAGEALAQMEELSASHGRPEEIELGLASDDHEAQALGWPCVGAHRAVLVCVVARGMAEGYRFRVVPRGSTVSTAAVADAD